LPSSVFFRRGTYYFNIRDSARARTPALRLPLFPDLPAFLHHCPTSVSRQVLRCLSPCPACLLHFLFLFFAVCTPSRALCHSKITGVLVYATSFAAFGLFFAREVLRLLSNSPLSFSLDFNFFDSYSSDCARNSPPHHFRQTLAFGCCEPMTHRAPKAASIFRRYLLFPRAPALYAVVILASIHNPPKTKKKKPNKKKPPPNPKNPPHPQKHTKLPPHPPPHTPPSITKHKNNIDKKPHHVPSRV